MAADGAAPVRGVCPVVAGPTAVGKTALIIGLAARWPIEVISLDSRQIYRGLRIGTAQPTAAEQAACPHHLVDFLPPTEGYSAARFRADFCRLHGEIRARGGVPLLVGGAGLYLSAVQDGLFPYDGPPGALARVRAELAPLPLEEIRSRLRDADPGSWERIRARDRYRSQRALEIFLATGQTMSAHLARQSPDPALGLRFPLVHLHRPRPELAERIAARTRAMLAAGWIDETAALVAEHGPAARALRAIGYREIMAMLEGRLAQSDLPTAIDLATRQYAKRQQTWFKALPAAVGGAPEDPRVEHVLSRLLQVAQAIP